MSHDGLWWWDGSQWVSAISQDGRWRWDGSQWVLNAPSTQPRPVRGIMVPTHDTRPLQWLVVGYLVVSAAIAAFVIPTQAASIFKNSLVFQPDSAAGDSALTGIVNTYVTLGIAVAIGWNLLLAVGALLRWRWVYYLFMIFGIFAGLSLVANLVTLAVNPNGDTATLAFVNVATGLAYVGIAGWMFRVWRERRTAWGMQPVVVPGA